jgi:signal transduction histidine kinase
MRFRTWPVAALGLMGLLALIAFSLSTAYDRAVGLSGQLDGANLRRQERFSQLRQVRSDVYLSAIYVRDYLLDNERARDPEYRRQLSDFRDSSRAALAELSALLPPDSDGADATERLRSSLETYWKIFDPLFFWTPEEKLTRSSEFVREEVLHRREEVLVLAREIEALNDASYDLQRGEIVRQRTEFQQGLRDLLWQSLVLGLIVTVVAVNRLRVLERRADEQRIFAENAEQRMRTLSQQIVATQEEERRKLSRELHDHVGQLLTGLRMGLGRIERVGQGGGDGQLRATVADSRQMVDDLTRIVRDLASGLRPSMLDDLGLAPALEWLGRDMSRRCGLPVTMTFEGGMEDLPDLHRTCAYRVVQEALTNVVRHANAQRADVTVQRLPHALSITVSDDGVGFAIDQTSGGIGLRGLEERVKELAGSVRIRSVPGVGTTVAVHLPVPEEVHHARLAG